MKMKIRIITAISAASLLGAAAVGQAQNYPGALYFNGSVGGALQQDMTVRNAAAGSKVGFDPGVLKDKLVLVGQSSAAGADRHYTPVFRLERQGC